MVERYLSKPTQFKRALATHLIEKAFRIKFREQTAGNAARLDETLRDGYKVVGLVPHFSKGDFLTILASLALNTEEVIKRPIVIPIAAHQRTGTLELLVKFGEINLASIITPDTKRKERELLKKQKLVPWNDLDPEQAMNQYLDTAISQGLMAGGIVFLAPQGGRRGSLRPFKGEPITRLDTRADQMGVDRRAYFAVGLEAVNATDYSEMNGLNFRSRYIVTLGKTTKRPDITENLDRWGYRVMLELAPPAYHPQKEIKTAVS